MGRSFMQVLPEIRQGKLVEDVTNAIAEVAQAVKATQKAGSVTITLSLKPGDSAENALVISDKIKSAAPQADKRPSLFFTDDEGALHRDDPNQHNLPLEPVRQVAKVESE